MRPIVILPRSLLDRCQMEATRASESVSEALVLLVAGLDLNQRPLGYECARDCVGNPLIYRGFAVTAGT